MVKYEQIAEELMQEIQNGKHLPGTQLPLEKELCDKYKVSRVTIKRAVDVLVNRGLVVKRRGWGTFVKTLDEEYAKGLSVSNQFLGFSETFKGREVHTEILKFEIVHPPEDIATKLNTSVDDFVYDIIRVRTLENIPHVVEYMMMPILLIPGLRKDTISASIYHYIEDKLKLKIQSAHRAIKAVNSTELERQYLQIDDNMPILEVEQVAFLSDGQPFEYSVSHHRGDKCTFSAISIR